MGITPNAHGGCAMCIGGMGLGGGGVSNVNGVGCGPQFSVVDNVHVFL